jgi:hypothetical protein
VTKIEIELPDDLAKRARRSGLFSNAAMRELLEEAIRRQAGRRLLDAAQRIEAANIAPMSLEEIEAEVKALRAERRGRRDPTVGADRP